MTLSNFGERFWLLSHGVTAAEYEAITPAERHAKAIMVGVDCEMAQMRRGLAILKACEGRSRPIPIHLCTEIHATERG